MKAMVLEKFNTDLKLREIQEREIRADEIKVKS